MNKKKWMIALSCTALLLVGIVGATLALMTAKTEEKVNTFTTATITGELKEPSWDGDNFTDPDNQIDVPNPLGEELAENFVPSRVIPKDPAIANTSAKEMEAWVAVKLDYKYKGEKSDWKTLFGDTGFADIVMNDTNWTFNETKTIAYYNNKLAGGAKTDTLFDQIKIKNGANTKDVLNEDGTLKYIAMGDFEINITGYLVQGEGVDSAKEGMQEEFPDVFK